MKENQGLVTIQDPEQRYSIAVAIRRNRNTVRGRMEYRRALKDIISQVEAMLGPYRKRKASL